MTSSEYCNVANCPQTPASLLEGEALCRSHFISACYTWIERYEQIQKEQGLSAKNAESLRRFIHECSMQADEIENTTKDLDNLERAKLIHIILAASELGRHLRRSPRKVASIAVRLSSDRIGGSWEEDTETVLLSRYGAAVQCRHSAKPGECLQIMRSDTGQKIQAQVMWQRPSDNESVRIGLEFEDNDNFWGLDWASVEEGQ